MTLAKPADHFYCRKNSTGGIWQMLLMGISRLTKGRHSPYRTISRVLVPFPEAFESVVG